MSNKIIVHKNRTNSLQVNLGVNVAGDTFSSEIRAQPDVTSLLICAWEVSFLSNGADGKLVLKLDDLITSQIKVSAGYMDLKRIRGGEPIPVFDEPLEVSFRGAVTL